MSEQSAAPVQESPYDSLSLSELIARSELSVEERLINFTSGGLNLNSTKGLKPLWGLPAAFLLTGVIMLKKVGRLSLEELVAK